MEQPFSLLLVITTACCMGATADRQRFPCDEILWEWEANNNKYQTILQEQIELFSYQCPKCFNDDGTCLVTPAIARKAFIPPRKREIILMLLAEELTEAKRINKIIYEIKPARGYKPKHWDYWIWMARAREIMTEEEYGLGRIPYGGFPGR